MMVVHMEEKFSVQQMKNEIDIGIEKSIQRCEALLAMVPLSLQSFTPGGQCFLLSFCLSILLSMLSFLKFCLHSY
jgi:hypothetical protein